VSINFFLLSQRRESWFQNLAISGTQHSAISIPWLVHSEFDAAAAETGADGGVIGAI
jgi:hypothetical protein